MKRISILKTSFYLASLMFILLTNSCAPIFSEMQNASTVGKNNMEGTASFSTVSFRDTEEKDGAHIQNHIGLQGAYGLSDAVDLRFRYARVWLDDDIGDLGANVFGIGPKFSLVKDRLAAYIPIGFAFGKDVGSDANTWQIHPTIIGTIPVSDKFEVNPSFKALFPFEKDAETTVAFNLGLGLELTENLSFRPEFGMLFNPGEKGHFKQFSVGMVFRNLGNMASPWFQFSQHGDR